MRLGADTNTRWLWFITYILLPLNVIAQIFWLFWFLDAGQGGLGILFILAELCLAIATILGLHHQKPWGWYCIIVIYGIQLIGTPLKVHAKASMRYEITQAANSYLQNEGRAPLSFAKPSLFDSEPMLTFFLLMFMWTTPNLVYMYRRKHLFGLTESLPDNAVADAHAYHSSIQSNLYTARDTKDEERAYELAMCETEAGGELRKGIWSKAFALSQGDQNTARAKYIELRSAQILQMQEQERLCVVAREGYHDVIRWRFFGNSRGTLKVLEDRFVYESVTERLELPFGRIRKIFSSLGAITIRDVRGAEYSFRGASLRGTSAAHLAELVRHPATHTESPPPYSSPAAGSESGEAQRTPPPPDTRSPKRSAVMP